MTRGDRTMTGRARSKSWTGVLWPASCALAFGAGALLFSSSPKSEGGPAAAFDAGLDGGPEPAEVAGTGSGFGGPAPADAPRAAADGASSGDAASARAGRSGLQRLMSAALGDTSADSGAQLRALADTLSLDDVQAGLDRIGSLPPGPQSRRLESLLVDRWAQLEPLKALEYARNVSAPMVREELRMTALQAWARVEPMQALVYADLNPDGDLPRNRLDVIFDGVRRAPPADALLFLQNIDAEKYAPRIMDTVFELYRRSPDEVVRWAEQLPAGRLRDDAFERIIDHWARYDPAGAQQWMDSRIAPEFRTRANIELAESWARLDPRAAEQWYETLPDPQRDPEIRNRIFRRWMEFESPTAIQWLDGQPPSRDKDPLYEMAVERANHQEPKVAAAWAERITDDKHRNRALEGVAWHWGRHDPAAMRDYVAASGMADDQKKRLTQYAEKRLQEQAQQQQQRPR